MAYTYTPHDWTTQEPITQEKMDHIEQGIAGAVSTANANTATIDSIEDQINTLTSNVSILQRNVGNNFGSDLNNIKEELRNARGDSSLAVKFDTIDSSITDATNKANAAVSAIKDTYEFAEEETLKDVIAEIKRTDDAQWIQINSNKASLDAASTGLGLAQRLVNIEKDIRDTNAELKAGDPDTVLSQKLAARDSAIAQVGTRIDNVNTKIENVKATLGYTASSSSSKTIYQMITDAVTQAQGYADNVSSTAYNDAYGEIVNTNNTLTDKIKKIATELNMIDSNNEIQNENTIIDTFKTYTTEIKNARGKDNDSLKDRLDGIDSTISEMDTAYKAADDAINNKLGTGIGTDANATGTTATAGKQLADIRADIGTNNTANTIKGRINTLENAIGTDDTSSTVKYRIKQLEDEVSAARGTGNTLLKNRLDNIDTTTTDLDARLDKIDGGSELVGTTLATRVSNAESAITTLNGDADTSGSVLNTVNSRIAEVVNNAPEAFDTLKEIADWIGDNSDDALTMQTNISNNANAISGLNTRLTAIDNDTTGRMKIAEDDIDAIEEKLGSGFDSTTGNTVADKIAAAIITAANDATTKANAAKSYTDTQLLTKADATIIDNISTTIVKNKAQVSYTDGVPNNTQSWTIDDKDDYLLQNNDDKYYYWKHINNEWHLMGGAGDNNSGNTSGFVYTMAQYNDLKNNHADQLLENADYYVLQSDIQYEGENSRSIQAYHHYRYVKNNNNILQEIEIGEPISRAKTYTIEREDDATTGNSYLNLYEFDYGLDNSAITDDPRMYLRAKVDLPKGGDGESSATSLKLIRLNDENRQVRIGRKIYLYAYFSAIADEQTENGQYVLKYNGVTIDSNNLTSGKASDDPSNWIVVENPEFTDGLNPTPLINSPDSNKLYIVQQHTSNGDIYTQWTYNNGTWTSTLGYPNGFIAFDVTNRCKAGDNTFTLTATAVNKNRSRTWNINIVDLRLETNAPDTLLININDPYNFSYIPYGAIQKSLKVTIDNDSPKTKSLSTSSGLESFYELTGLTHGAHTIRMQLTANINGKLEESDEIIRQYIWYDPNESSSDVILASGYNNVTETVEQYTNIEIPYQVYKKGASSILAYYYLDDAETPFRSVQLIETNSGILSYIATTEGNHKLTIKVEDQEINVNLIVTPATKSIAPVSGAIIDFDPALYSNDAIERLPQWKVGSNTYKFTDSPNFNWSNNPNGGGYKEDEDGKCFVIKAGSYIDLNYNLFRTEQEAARANVFKRGAEMKIIFKTKAVRNTKAIWLTNTGDYQNKKVGLTLKAHYGELRTDKAIGDEEDLSNITADEDGNLDTITVKGVTYNYWKPNTSYIVNTIVVIRDIIYKCIDAENTSFSINLQDKEIDLDDRDPKDYLKKWLKLGQLNTEIVSTDSYLYFPYSENDKIELDININSSDGVNQFIMSYEDGVPSKAYAYTNSDHLQHNNTIHIGSPDCDVYIYKLRIYDRALSTVNILQNFIADGKTVEEKVLRHDRNCIYWNNTEKKYYIQKTGEAKLDPIKLAELMPDVKILMLDVPHFTTGKKDFIKDTTLRCIHADGGKVYPSRGDADNWFFDNGFHAGQGTTSDNYGQSARNVDFLFEVDGTHWPTKSKNMTGFTNPPDYKSRVWIGKNASKYIITEEDEAGHWVPTSKYDENIQDWIIDNEVVSAEEEINPTVPSICNDWMGDDCKISLTSTSIPNNYFNLKENVASSENVNNALFQKRYNDFLPYDSPAKKRDSRIKNSMEFVPAVLFIRESGPLADHTEFADTDWHFYGLGNLGDSKKTDYTRAYDPEDMYEFTCENSDNNTNNGQFQSGVFMYNGTRAIETNYAAWNENTKYGENAIVISEGKIYQYTGEEMSQAHAWNNSEWNDITPVGNETHYYAPRTNPDTMSYMYPITSEEWNITLNNNYVNRKHYTLVNEAFDGDHSFEFRYACCGDFRDGDRINDTHGGTGTYKTDKKGNQVEITVDDVQEELNHDVICALYEWLITSTEDQYKNEASQWMIKPAMEFFYAFTHYYTMMDNRAKNTFWHFARTGEHRKVTRPVKELLHVYEESNNAVKNVETGVYTGTFTKTALTTLPETYYVQGYIPVTDKHFKDGVTYYKLNINTNTYTTTTSVNYTDKDGAPLTMTIKPDYEIPETAEALYTLGFIQTEESKFLSGVQYYTYTNNTYVPATVTVGDPIKYLYTQYAFDLWVYDTDTALGIDNNGAQVFPYGKEDDDYRVKNEPSSGWAFNGAGSIFWRRLKTTFIDEIADVMNNTQDCFNSEGLINEFDSFQNCFPEEIWRLDIERKYIRTFTGVTNELPYDNAVSEGKQNARFLMSMMQGRKKYQRRQWIRNQGVYFNSKYLLKDIKDNSNTTEFNIITPTGDINNLAVKPAYNLQLTPYQDMYLNVTIGNGGPTPSIRAEAGKTYTIDLLPYSAGTFAETRLYIYGFKSIAGLGNLAPMYPYSFTLNGLEHLKELDLGTDNNGYRNFNLTALPFKGTQLPLLEKFNVRNCNNLAGGIDLSTANNLLEVKADGTLISSIDLPRYTHIENLYLPYTVQNLELYNAHYLKDLKIYNNGIEDYTNLYTLIVHDSDYSGDWKANTEYAIGATALIDDDYYRCIKQHTSVSATVKTNSTAWNEYLTENWTPDNKNVNLPIDWISIAQEVIAKESLATNLSLTELHSAYIKGIQTLNNFSALKKILDNEGNGKVELGGTIRVLGDWSTVEKEQFETIWSNPPLNLDVSQGTNQIKYTVTYKYDNYSLEDGTLIVGDTITTIYVGNDAEIPDIYTNGVLKEKPHRDSTVRNNYIFGEEDSGSYIRLSGWRRQGQTDPIYKQTDKKVHGNTIIETYFTTETRRYPVKWYMNKNKPDSLVKTSVASIPYGGGEDLEAPTVAEIHAAKKETATATIIGDSVTISIFNGWEALPINIHPKLGDESYNIYALWDTKTKSLEELFADTTNLTPEQLLVYSQMNSDLRNEYKAKIDILSKFTYTLGQDSIEPGRVLIGPGHELELLNNSDILRLDKLGEEGNPIVTNIQPLSKTNNAFTIVIDYCFNTNKEYESNINSAILASCYYQDNTNENKIVAGFALYYNCNNNLDLSTFGPRVGFGDMFNDINCSVPVGNVNNAGDRNIVVLRHPANTSTLYVYSGLTDSDGLNSPVVVQRIDWNNVTTEAFLNFGQLTDSKEGYYDLTNAMTKAAGTIYYAKYWNKDLGAGECKRLASWPHESMTYGIYGIANKTSGSPLNNNPDTSINITSLTSSAHGRVTQGGKTGVTPVGWGTSQAREVCNNILFEGLPTKLQSIINRPLISYYNGILQSSTGVTSYSHPDNTNSSNDYIYLPSVVSLIDSNANEDKKHPSHSVYTIYQKEINNNDYQFTWIKDENVSIYNYSSSEGKFIPSSESNRAKYMNLRFAIKPINLSLRIFKTNGDISGITIYELINNSVAAIQTGDIFVQSYSDNNIAYMFVSNDDINKLGVQRVNNEGIYQTSAGGWLASNDYWTRSMTFGESRNTFAYVSKAGDVTTSNNNKSSKLYLSYSFSI